MSTNTSTSVSNDDHFCKCKRKITRAFRQAIQLGDFCPSCGLRLSKTTLLRAKTLERLNSFSESDPIYHNLRYQNSSFESNSSTDTQYDIPEENNNMNNLVDVFQQLANTIAANRIQQNLAFQPPPFKGSATDDIDDFLSKFRNFCDYNDKNDADRVQIFPLLLQGKAYQVYNAFEDDTKHDIDLLTEEMRTHFSHPEMPILEAAKVHRLINEIFRYS